MNEKALFFRNTNSIAINNFGFITKTSKSDFPKIKANPDITVIGHMTASKDGVNLITKGGTSHPLTAQGWDSLLKKD
jgi:thiamine-monophosphate kinase